VEEKWRTSVDHTKYVGGGIEDGYMTITSPITDDTGLYTCIFVANAVGAVSEVKCVVSSN
jgi:hypothetical protein